MLAFIVLLTSCTSILQSSPAMVTDPSGKGANWTIIAKNYSGTLSDTIILYINGTEIARGTVNPVHHAAHLTGSYEQHAILGDCDVENPPESSWARWGSYQCIIYVDGSDITTLKLQD
ncbi:MAG: hypothetical protein ACRESE_00915 [Gammaproteobacteria bacterium]